MSLAIRVDNLGKRYRLGLTHSGSIRELLNRTIDRLLRRKHPPAQLEWHQRPGVRTDVDPDGGFWALREVSFAVKPGEVVGIIGRNGSGKSTLLKVLSQITAPTCGRVELHGRVASLLEVGTGFHSELSGRENVFL
jgi:lipopolysaccharide transport system ATP-binding protein